MGDFRQLYDTEQGVVKSTYANLNEFVHLKFHQFLEVLYPRYEIEMICRLNRVVASVLSESRIRRIERRERILAPIRSGFKTI